MFLCIELLYWRIQPSDPLLNHCKSLCIEKTKQKNKNKTKQNFMENLHSCKYEMCKQLTKFQPHKNLNSYPYNYFHDFHIFLGIKTHRLKTCILSIKEELELTKNSQKWIKNRRQQIGFLVISFIRSYHPINIWKIKKPQING